MDRFLTQSKQARATNDDTTIQQKAKGPSDIGPSWNLKMMTSYVVPFKIPSIVRSRLRRSQYLHLNLALNVEKSPNYIFCHQRVKMYNFF